MKKTWLVALAISTLACLPVRADDAKATYDKECSKCHGADGKGETRMGKRLGAKDYTDPKVQADLKDEAAFKAIKEGIKKDDKTVMKPSERNRTRLFVRFSGSNILESQTGFHPLP